MARLRVLILDDNVSWRRTLTRSLDTEDGVEILGATGVGEVGLEKLCQLLPDAVLLSVSTRGAETAAFRMLEDVKTARPKLPVVVVSTVNDRGSPVALEFLTKGAAGFAPLALPGADSDSGKAAEAIRSTILSKLSPLKLKLAPAVELPRSRSSHVVEAIAVGVSTGGPDVLARILPELPANFPVPVFVVQHILPEFTRSLTDRLQKICPNPVREAAEGEIPQPGTIWIAPSDRHLEVVRNGNGTKMHLSDAPPENLCRPAADVLFRSAARTYGSGLLAVVLTGMGSDGLRGCREIRETGGTVLVQDKASCVVWGMPGAVAEAGLANEILTPPQIATELIRRAGRGGTSHSRH